MEMKSFIKIHFDKPVMKLSIIIPVYNEEKTILEILERVEKVDLGDIEKEIVLVDDFSKDRSREILKGLSEKYKVLFHEVNKGKGAAIKTGLGSVTGDYVIIQDADLEYDPEDYKGLIKILTEKNASVVYGSRFLGVTLKSLDYAHPLHYFGNKFLTLFTNVLYGTKVTDMETCYKLVKADVIKGIPLRARRFDFEPEITSKLLKRGHKIVEVPISYNSRSFDEGKKITWKDGVKAVGYLLRYRFFD